MKKMIGFFGQTGALAALIVFCAKGNFSLAEDMFCVIGCVLLMVPVTIIGRKILDGNVVRAGMVTMTVQAFRMVLYSTAVTRAIKSSGAWTMGLALPIPEPIGLAILVATGMALGFTFLNLALRGLGAPAFSESVKLAQDWLYSKMRNPMVLAAFMWLVSWGIYLQSMPFVLWVLVLVVPVECFFERHYEERELELRFGEGYLQYKAVTPFMFPRIAFLEYFGKVASAASKYVFVLALLIVIGVATDGSAADWKAIPFSNGGAYIDTDNVYEYNGVLSFWFMARKVAEPSKYQEEITSGKDSWTYRGQRFHISIRKVEVDMRNKPRLTRSPFAVYYDADGRPIAEPETGNPKWVPETGPRLWTDLLSATFAKNQQDPGTVPAIPASR